MRELGIHKIEVHVAAVCLAWTDDGAARILALKRSPTKQLFPNLWEGVGGQVLDGESLDEAITRHLREEANLTAYSHAPFTTYVIEPNNSGADERIPGVRYIAEVPFESPILDQRQHTEYRWLSVDELGTLDWIPGMLPQVVEGVARVLGDAGGGGAS